MDLVRSALQLDRDNMSMTRSEPGFWRLAEYANTQIQAAGVSARIVVAENIADLTRRAFEATYPVNVIYMPRFWEMKGPYPERNPMS